MKNSKDIVYPTFKDAQELFSSYSTLQSNNILYEALLNTVDSSFINAFSFKNVREIYNNIILRYYPNEICIKSSFINQILLKTKNHITIFELPVGNSRADLCKINGSSIAYEIKTDLDNLLRLDKQLNDYLQIFEKVYVICSENKLTEVEKHILPSCGIYTYSMTSHGNLKFKIYHDASFSNKLNVKKQLSILRKQELIQYFTIDKIQNRGEMIEFILEEFSEESINHIFKQIIKSRYKEQWEFIKTNHSNLLEIDYQWFFKNTVNPKLIYG